MLGEKKPAGHYRHNAPAALRARWKSQWPSVVPTKIASAYLDNAATKAIFDLLVAHQVIECDSKVMRITSGWDRSVPAGHAIIIVKPAVAMTPS